MATKISMAAAFLLAVLAAAAMLQSTNAATHVVGDTTGWTIPSNNNFYETWAENKNFSVGDVLVFNFATGAHDVAEVSETNYDNCNTNANTISTTTTGPANVTLNKTGNHYYICTFGTHCANGQKLKINVESGSTASTPGSSPTGTTTTSPPNSASSLVATLSLVFISIALVLFC